MLPQISYLPGTCSFYGNNHIKTFDGKYYDMKGQCAYVLSKHCHVPNGSPKYDIRLLNKKCEGGSSPGSRCDKEIEIRIVGEPVIVLRHSPLATIDGKALKSSFVTADLQITFLGMNNVLVKSLKASITILWTGYNLFLRVDSSMFQQTCGLCGTFDDDISNDFHTHDDDNEISERSFSLQWKVVESSTPKCHGEQWEDTKSCDFYYDKKPDAIERCKVLKYDKSFETCHKFVSPDIYYDNCLSDACASTKEFIEVVRAYVKMCADEGIFIKGFNDELSKPQPGKYGIVNAHIIRPCV